MLVVGAYALAWGRTPEEHASVIDAAADEAAVGGLEVPWTGSLGSPAPMGLLGTRPDWRLVVTSLPRTLAQGAAQPGFGLASEDPDRRQAAVADAASLRSAVASLNDTLGRAAVAAIEVHSAPSPQDVPSARRALARSLDSITGWDWDGAEILLEHVDARVEGHTPSKGFLSLGDEIEVIRDGSLKMGVLINWGRSAIELRSAANVVDHIAMARESGLLRGLIFSGASGVPTKYGDAWADQHLPPRSYERDSLLTGERMEDALQVAGPLDYTGVKMSWRPPSLREGTVMLLSTARMVSGISARNRQSIS